MTEITATLAWIEHHEPTIRLTVFALMFSLVATWEALRPHRPTKSRRTLRWSNNLALALVNTALLRLTAPLLAVGSAAVAAEFHFGLFNQMSVALFPATVASLIALDFVVWLQHRAFHSAPILWRIHQVHHADLDVDVTTGLRFHPFEIGISMVVKIAAIALLGIPTVAVVVFEVILNATSLFNHANARLPARLDNALRWIIVTPDMHRVHHSKDRTETNTNFGFNLPWWDRLFGTYCDAPRLGQDRVEIGTPEFDHPRDVCWLSGLLTMPLRRTQRHPH